MSKISKPPDRKLTGTCGSGISIFSFPSLLLIAISQRLATLATALTSLAAKCRSMLGNCSWKFRLRRASTIWVSEAGAPLGQRPQEEVLWQRIVEIICNIGNGILHADRPQISLTGLPIDPTPLRFRLSRLCRRMRHQIQNRLPIACHSHDLTPLDSIGERFQIACGFLQADGFHATEDNMRRARSQQTLKMRKGPASGEPLPQQ